MFAANMNIFKVCFLVLRNLFLHRRDLIPENLAFRQQLAVQQRTCPFGRPEKICIYQAV